MKQLPPPIPPKYQQPKLDFNGRTFSTDSTCEVIHYVENKQCRFWYNNQFEGYSLHHHEAMEFIICLDQTYDVYVNGTHYHMNVGDILFIPPNMLHEIKDNQGGARFICLACTSILEYIDASNSLRPIFMQPFFCTPGTQPYIYDRVYRLLTQAIDCYFENEPTSELEICALLFQTLSCVCKSFYSGSQTSDSTRKDPLQREHFERIRIILNYIEENFMEEISLDKAASITGFSKYHFARIFKEQTNTTFADYVTKRRIHEAQKLLNTDLPLMDICLTTGFHNPTTFYRAFKKVTGVSPSDYKQQLRNEPEERLKSRTQWVESEKLRALSLNGSQSNSSDNIFGEN